MDKNETITHQQHQKEVTCSQKIVYIIDKGVATPDKMIDNCHLISVQGFIMHQWILIKRWHSNKREVSMKKMNLHEQVNKDICSKALSNHLKLSLGNQKLN